MPRELREWTEFGQEPNPDDALKAGDFRSALGGFATEHLLEFRWNHRNSDGPAIGFGVALWLLGDIYGAAMVWSKVCDEATRGRYSYSSMATFQGGLLLWFASVWLKDDEWHGEAEVLLDKLLRKKRPAMGSAFPSVLAKLLRGDVDLRKVDFSTVSLLREREETQAFFYAGCRGVPVLTIGR